MPTPRRRRAPKPDRVRALELLAACPEGCNEAILVAHHAERVLVGKRIIRIARLSITPQHRSRI
jgi:hypothetical protein